MNGTITQPMPKFKNWSRENLAALDKRRNENVLGEQIFRNTRQPVTDEGVGEKPKKQMFRDYQGKQPNPDYDFKASEGGSFPKKYVFNITPVGKPRMTRQDKWMKRPCVLRFRAYEDEMNRQANEIGFVMNPTALYIEFHFKRPKSFTGIRAQMITHKNKPDLDNLIKGVQDIFLKNDSSISEIHAKKIWSDTGKIIIWK